MRNIPPPEQMPRVWSLVDKRGPDECWPWMGCKSPRGYGRFGWGAKPYSGIASRAVYHDTHPLEDMTGKEVCHTCDNPICCNPAHLWLGTPAQNQKDKFLKGRQVRGERHPAAKLSRHQVATIRDSAVATKELAGRFGVCRTTIQRIRNGRLWSDRKAVSQ